MVQAELVTRKVGGMMIPHRITDGYINASLLCQACGKAVEDYLDQGCTEAFLTALARQTGLSCAVLVQEDVGASRGTWVHPQVAINLGQWCSPQFAVLVSGWVVEWLIQRQAPAPAHPSTLREPVYVKRLALAYDMQVSVPEGYWTVFDKCSNLLILVECKLKLPVERYDLLDGSVGIRWASYREGKHWAGERERYTHVFPDQRGEREAWAYRLDELPQFELWLRRVYIPTHLPAYLESKYPFPNLSAAALIARATGIHSLPQN